MAQAPTLSAPLAPSDRALTVDDWFELPDDGNRYELFEGLLLLVPSPNRSHQDAVLKIGARILHITEQAGGYVAIAPLGVALSETIGFEPDVFYVARGHDEILSDRGIDGVPDLVVEVLSASTRAFDRGTKSRTYLELGVREVWLVDLEARTVTVRAQGNAEQIVAFGDEISSAIISIGAAGLA